MKATLSSPGLRHVMDVTGSGSLHPKYDACRMMASLHSPVRGYPTREGMRGILDQSD